MERLSIVDDDALKHITIRNPYNYPKPERVKIWMAQILGEGVLLADGAEHVHQRKVLGPAFSIQAIRALTPVFWEKALLLNKCLDKEIQKHGSKTIEVLEWFNRTTLDIIGKAGFGDDINSLEIPDTPIREAYRLVFAFDLISHVLHGFHSFFPWSKGMPTSVNRDLEASRSIILRKATEIIIGKQEEAMSNSGGKDIIALIAKDNKALQEAGEKGLSFETMRDQIMTFLGAGHDTTATGVAWTLHLLSRHQDIQVKLREEIRGYLPYLFDVNYFPDIASLATFDLDRLPYLNNVCRESLRYIPPVPTTVRQSLENDTLAGYHVPAGTILYVSANTINRVPEFWGENADSFDPDRWTHLPETWTSNAYMSFLQGPRGCIGRKFAETEMKILLCCLLSMYEFRPDEASPNPELWKMWRLVLRPKYGMNLELRKI